MRSQLLLILIMLTVGRIGLYAQTPLQEKIKPPESYTRIAAPAGFASTLGDLPLHDQKELIAGDGVTVLCDDEKSAVSSVKPFDNKNDVGVDAVVRLWGEYLWNHSRRSNISFPLDNGQIAKWKDWQEGLRPKKQGGMYIFVQVTTPSASFDAYNQYLAFVAEEMGAIALKRESQIVLDDSVAIGDMLVSLRKDGSSWVGLILDMCKNRRSEKLFLIGTCGSPSTTMYIPRPYATVQGEYEWFTLDGAKYFIGAGARVDLRRVSLE